MDYSEKNELLERIDALIARVQKLEDTLCKVMPGSFQKQKMVVIEEPMVVKSYAGSRDKLDDYTGPRRVFLFGKYRYVDGENYPTEEECVAMDQKVRDSIKTDNCVTGMVFEHADTDFHRKEKEAMKHPDKAERKSWLWTGDQGLERPL